jgi:hypothetical protein
LRIIQLLVYIDSVEEVLTPVEVELQKPRNLSASEIQERGHGEGVGVYVTLLQSDSVQSYGRAKADTRYTRPLGVGLCKKPKHLTASEREERGHGKGEGVYTTLLQSDTVHPYGRAKAGKRPVGVGLRKKPKDLSSLSVSDIEDHGHGKGVDVHATLLQSVTVHPYGRAKTDTRSVGVGLHKETKDLIGSEREERWYGEGVGVHPTSDSQIQYSHMVTQKQARDLWGLGWQKTKGPECM